MGIDAYPAPVPPLAGCVGDIVAAHTNLLARVGDDRLDARLLLDEQATRAAVIDGFRTHLAQAGPDDVALFYFNGHGSQQASAPAIDTEPDRHNETIVLVDSRRPPGRDLADKELATLIAPVAARAGHALVILDCCHSGDGTRGIEPGTRLRVAAQDGRVRPPDTFLDEMPEPGPHPDVVRGGATDASPDTRPGAAGTHVLIAACRSSETAKETTVDGTSRGVLSASLEDVLREAREIPSYREVLLLVTARTLLRVPDQHPQVESVSALNLDRPFLGGAIPAEAPQLTISHLPAGWGLDAGAIHGISAPIGGDCTELAVYPLTGQTSGSPPRRRHRHQGAARPVPVDLSTSLDEGFVYRAVVTGIPLSPLPSLSSAVTPTPLPSITQRPARTTRSSPSSTPATTRPSSSRPRPTASSSLAPGSPDHWSQSSTNPATWRAPWPLEHVARWLRLSTLDNPATSIPAGAISISTTSDAGALGPATEHCTSRMPPSWLPHSR